MEINITKFVADADAFEFSASRAERGQNAGPETWANAKEEGAARPLLDTPAAIAALRNYVKDFGAWEDEEIAGWSDVECNALFIQLVAGDMREGGLDGELDDAVWAKYEKRAERGNCSGNIYRGGDGEIYYGLCR